jgi:hypothetical protein
MKKITKVKGLGSHAFILLGFTLSSVQIKISNFLENNLEKNVMLHSLKEELLEIDKDEKDSKRLILERSHVEERLISINEELKEINKSILTPLRIPFPFPLLKTKIISKMIIERFSHYQSNKDLIRLYNENLRLKIINQFKPLLDSLKKIIQHFSDKEKFEGIDETSKESKSYIREAINIYSIGYGKTAVLCLGRDIENEINNYLRGLKKRRKITPRQFKEFINNKYNNKLGFLKEKFIDEEEFTKLKAFSFDRDKGGHPDLGEIDNNRARTLIQQGVWLIIDLQKKINKLNKIKKNG